MRFMQSIFATLQLLIGITGGMHLYEAEPYLVN